MAVRKIRGWWCVDLRSKRRRYRIRSPENSRVGAARYELVLRQYLSGGAPLESFLNPPKNDVPTLAEFSADWFETYVKVNNKHSEQINKRTNLKRHLIPAFGRLPLDQISSEGIERYKSQKLHEGLGPKTVNNHLAILRKCLHTAQDWGSLVVIPKMKFLRVPPPSFDFLIPQESHALLAATNQQAWRLMILTALRTGMRFGELVALDWSDVDLSHGIIAVRRSLVNGHLGTPKNNRTRFLPITPELHAILTSYGKTQGYVFSLVAGHPISYSTAMIKLREFAQRAGLRRVRWHMLRHTFASQLVAAGVPISAVQEMLGHSTLEMTRRYAHLAPSTLQQAVDILDLLPRQNATFGQQAVNTPQKLVPAKI